MLKKRALKDAARDPLAEKGVVVRPEDRRQEKKGLVHYVLAVSVGIILGLAGGLLANRLWRIL